jgi:hypothetical protein
MISDVLSLAVPLFLFSLGACSGDSGTSPVPLGVVGVWNQGANLRDSVSNQTHIHTGYFSFEQERAGFAGAGEQSGLCTGPHGDYVGLLANGEPFSISDGIQRGNQVSFKTDLCTYEGTLSADEAHIEGSARCAYTEGGVSLVWKGDWLANRES